MLSAFEVMLASEEDLLWLISRTKTRKYISIAAFILAILSLAAMIVIQEYSLKGAWVSVVGWIMSCITLAYVSVQTQNDQQKVRERTLQRLGD